MPPPDLIIAAVAERHGLTVLHYDHDYDFVADVTSQSVEWVVPKGTADAASRGEGMTGRWAIGARSTRRSVGDVGEHVA